MQENETLRAEN